ncbi:MAG: protein kinase [Gammaproteobacteria bacterium]|nr:protein kinase [Gammaproteobacteria bacterium]
MIHKDILRQTLLKNSQWLIDQMSDDGRFLYQSEKINHNLKQEDNTNHTQSSYYNIVRHCGSSIILLRAYEYFQDEIFLNAAKQSITYFLSTLKQETTDASHHYYPVYNHKVKLGAAGLGLASLVHYYRLSSDKKYRAVIDGLVQHILSRITKDGELIAYYLHPLINNGEAIDFEFLSTLDSEQRSKVSSYYFPGQALLGLALYYHYIDDIPDDFKQTIISKSKSAFDYILADRACEHKRINQLHCIDTWTMQAIEAWALTDHFNETAYSDYAFNQTNQFIELMTEEENLLLKEYIDASCCEGIISAYFLAEYLGKKEQANYIISKILHYFQTLLSKELSSVDQDSILLNKLFDSKQCLDDFYCKLKHKSINMDLIHHIISFLSRLLTIEYENLKPDDIPLEIIADYRLIKVIKTNEYSEIFLAHVDDEKINNIIIKKGNYSTIPLLKNGEVVIKKVSQFNDNKLLVQERKIFYLARKEHNSPYFYCIEHLKSTHYHFFVNQYFNQGNLNQWLKSGIRITEQIAIEFLQKLLAIFEQMQKYCLLHLNINPDNILVKQDKNTGELGFSLCGWAHSQFASFVYLDKLDETNHYLPPEAYKGYLTTESDLYALGAVLYFMLEGKTVFNLREHSTTAHIAYSHLFLEPEFSEKSSKKIQYIILRMMDKNYHSRASIEEIIEIIQSKQLPEQSITPYTLNRDITDHDLHLKSEAELWQQLAKKGYNKFIPPEFKN